MVSHFSHCRAWEWGGLFYFLPEICYAAAAPPNRWGEEGSGEERGEEGQPGRGSFTAVEPFCPPPPASHWYSLSLSLSLPPASVRLSLLLTPCLFLSLFPSRRWMIPGAPLSKIQNTNLATSDEECSHCTASQDLHSPLLAASASAK